ncbi:MAG: SH3 domain-containing protein [Anaerolineae bacterium]|nr:SH3 domain-containing protein [Anaerolineae bacterium]
MSEQPKPPEPQPDDETQPMRTRRTVEPPPRPAHTPHETPPAHSTPPPGGVIPRRPVAQPQRRVPPPTPPPEAAYTGPPQYVVPTAEVVEPTPAKRSPRESGLYFPWWSVVGMVVVAGLLSCGLWALVFSSGGDAPPGGRTPTFIITTATSAPASAATLPPTVTPTPTEAAPTDAPPPTLPPSNIDIGIGVQVEIVGTGPAGLNIRDGPSTVYESVDVANEGEIFTIQDGPEFGSGYEWWYLVDPANPDRAGWSVREFMQVIGVAPEGQ